MSRELRLGKASTLPCCGEASTQGFVERLRPLEEEHQAKAAREGRRFLGVARVLAQSPFASPRPGEPRFELNPRIAGRDKWRRIEAIFRLKSFLQEYRKAWRAWRAGDGGALFPPGTFVLSPASGGSQLSGAGAGSASRDAARAARDAWSFEMSRSSAARRHRREHDAVHLPAFFVETNAAPHVVQFLSFE